jgi:hypothetical protein
MINLITKLVKFNYKTQILNDFSNKNPK